MVSHPKSRPVTKIALGIHPIREVAQQAVEIFKSAADSVGIEIIELGKSDADCQSLQCDIVASIGGDGTLLGAIRSAWSGNIPVWGVNVGGLGYLTITSVDEIAKCIELLARGDYWIEYRSLIEAVISGESGEKNDGQNLTAFNDIVLHRHVPGGGLIVFEVELDGHFLGAYEADGLIFSTPTGSTAYNLSAGGSILSPDLPAFIITPICAHSFSARSLVISDSLKLIVRPKIKMPDDYVLVTADGQEMMRLEKCSLSVDDKSDGASVEIHRAEKDAGLVRFEEIFFFDILRDKLGWAEGHPNHRNQ